MKKTFKIVGYSVLGLFVLVLILAGIAIGVVFTPNKITPIVRKQAQKALTCEVQLKEVELTFFSTFPNFALKINNLTLRSAQDKDEDRQAHGQVSGQELDQVSGQELDQVSGQEPSQELGQVHGLGTPSDTILSVEEFSATIDVMAYLKKHQVVLNGLDLKNGLVSLYTSAEGVSNFDVMRPSSSDKESDDNDDENDEMKQPMQLQLSNIIMDGVTVIYRDDQTKTYAKLNRLSTHLSGRYGEEASSANLQANLDGLVLAVNDSTMMSADLRHLDLSLRAIMKGDDLSGQCSVDIPSMTLVSASDTLLLKRPLAFHTSLNFKDKKQLFLHAADLNLADFEVQLKGEATVLNDSSFDLNLSYLTLHPWHLDSLLALVPSSYLADFKGLALAGTCSFDGTVKGLYQDTIMPKVVTNVQLSDGMMRYSKLPYVISDLNTAMTSTLDLNGVSHLTIESFKAKAGPNSLDLKGEVNDFLNQQYCDLKLNTSLNLGNLGRHLELRDVSMKGMVRGNMQAKFAVDDAMNERFDRIKMTGNFVAQNLDVLYNDSMALKLDEGQVKLSMPSLSKYKTKGEWAQMKVMSPNMFVDMTGVGSVEFVSTSLDLGLGVYRKSAEVYDIRANYRWKNIAATMDTISLVIQKPQGQVTLSGVNSDLSVDYTNSGLKVTQPDLVFTADDIEAKVTMPKLFKSLERYADSTSTALFALPDVNLKLGNALVQTSALKEEIQIPTVNVDYYADVLHVNSCRMVIDESDFSLQGTVQEIQGYLNHTNLLKADFDFTSKETNITQLMDMVSGLGVEDSTAIAVAPVLASAGPKAVAVQSVVPAPSTQAPPTSTSSTQSTQTAQAEIPFPEADPFMVPMGVDVTLRTNIKSAKYETTTIDDVHGTLKIKDGVLVLEQMGFTSKAAQMQLTGIYRSPRRNHLYVGMDFHLLNVDLQELVQMIPDVDTVVPMLASFEGRGEFHFAIETYLFANYDVKYSTLRGAAALEGKDLVLMDNGTFSTISKYLMFKNSTRNKIDSLDVQLTIFKNEVDLYPFQISMGKYKAVIEGRHTLENNCNYQINVTQTPLPVRLALELKGPMDDLKYKLVPVKYKELYVPGKQNKLEQRTQYFKKLISDSLKANVKK